MIPFMKYVIYAIWINFMVTDVSVQALQMCGDRPCCECGKTYGKCIMGDESSETTGGGCSHHISCSYECPGDYSWKKMFNESRRKNEEIRAKCKGNPTEFWEPALPPGPETRFAIAFSGALRNYIATYHSWQTNVIEATGSNRVDLYFHVFDDQYNSEGVAFQEAKKLAMNCPNTKRFVIESMSKFMDYLNRDLPSLPDQPASESWLGAVEKELKPNQISPYRVGAGYSQWRKVYLCMEMIFASKIEYALVLRARPDHTVIEPFDLSKLHTDYYKFESVKRTKGHFIAIGERSKQVITDHWAVGTPRTMSDYAAQALPYTINCCEGYVWDNLATRCYARTDDVLKDEFNDVDQIRPLVEEAETSSRQWAVVPRWARGDSEFSPIMLCQGSLNTVGSRTCRTANKHAAAGDWKFPPCIPILRTRFSYVFRIEVGPWFANGALCVRYTNEGDLTAPFLIRAGIATPTVLTGVEKAWRTDPCIRVPKLKKAFLLAKEFLLTLSQQDQRTLIEGSDEVFDNQTMLQWGAMRRKRR